MKILYFLFLLFCIHVVYGQNNNVRINKAKELIQKQFNSEISYNKIYEHDRGFYCDFITNNSVYIINISADYTEFNKTLVYQFSEKTYKYLVETFPNFTFNKLEPLKNGEAEIEITQNGKEYEFIVTKENITPLKK